VDNAKCYITVKFQKAKSDATTQVINYLTHLVTQGKQPKAIQINGGGEFVNNTLRMWCKEKGIEIQMTAPYSPLQNGIAEQMNQTLMELTQAMLVTNNLSEFLWEYAMLHSAYIQNCLYTKHLKTSTPYQEWYGRKPNMAHL
jgi:transposase InsO family protein